jgi:hypothetical protein
MRGIRAGVAVLAVAWLVTFLVPPWSNQDNMDVGHFPPRAQEWIDGKLPYRDRKFEYPPLAVPLIGLPQLVKVGSYKLGFGLIELAFALALLGLCALAAQMTGGDARVAAVALALTPLLLGALVRGYFDFAPVALTLAALVAIAASRTTLGFGLLGALVVSVPFLVLYLASRALVYDRIDRRARAEGIARIATAGRPAPDPPRAG